MPARSGPNKPGPFAFACPSCGAKYIVLTKEIPGDARHSNKFGCVRCDTLFPVVEGRVSLEYILVEAEPNGDS
jgi:predicted Zn finger-like uncharacterized protein